jgi:hypothetical protein
VTKRAAGERAFHRSARATHERPAQPRVQQERIICFCLEDALVPPASLLWLLLLLLLLLLSTPHRTLPFDPRLTRQTEERAVLKGDHQKTGKDYLGYSIKEIWTFEDVLQIQTPPCRDGREGDSRVAGDQRCSEVLENRLGIQFHKTRTQGIVHDANLQGQRAHEIRPGPSPKDKTPRTYICSMGPIAVMHSCERNPHLLPNQHISLRSTLPQTYTTLAPLP